MRWRTYPRTQTAQNEAKTEQPRLQQAQAMNGMYDSTLLQRIDAQCQPLLRYLHKLTGVRYAAVSETGGIYELSPIHGERKHASPEQLADAEVWQKLV